MALLDAVRDTVQVFYRLFSPAVAVPDTATIRLDDGPARSGEFIATSSYSLAKELIDYLRGSENRQKLYREYQEVEKRLPMIGVALDMYADYTINGGEAETTDSFHITLPDQKSQVVIDQALLRLRMRDSAWSIVRGMCQFGDHFAELILDPTGLSRLKSPAPSTMYRIEDEYGRLQGFVHQTAGGSQTDLHKWQVVHWRLQANLSDLYGRSVLFGALRACRELGLVEDSATLARLTKGISRYKWAVDVGQEQDSDARQRIVDKAKAQNQHNVYMNSDGTVSGTTNILRATEDIWIPKMKDSVADVSVLPGDRGVGNVSDLDHKRDGVFMALRFPKSWYGLHGGSLTRADVDQSAVNAFRAVRRVRDAYTTGMRQVVYVALVGANYSLADAELLSQAARVSYPNITHSDILLKHQVDKVKAELAALYEQAKLYARSDIHRMLLQTPEDHIEGILKRADEDAKKLMELTTPPAAAAAAAATAGKVSGSTENSALSQLQEETSRQFKQLRDRVEDAMAELEDITALVESSHG